MQMNPNRTGRLAPLLVVLACALAIMLAVYVGGYFVLGERQPGGYQGRPTVHFDSIPSFRIYRGVIEIVRLANHRFFPSLQTSQSTQILQNRFKNHHFEGKSFQGWGGVALPKKLGFPGKFRLTDPGAQKRHMAESHLNIGPSPTFFKATGKLKEPLGANMAQETASRNLGFL
jgi:hypothetical protein